MGLVIEFARLPKFATFPREVVMSVCAGRLALVLIGPGLWPVMPFCRCHGSLPLVPVAKNLLDLRTVRALLSKFAFDDGHIATEISTGAPCHHRRRDRRRKPGRRESE